MYSILLFEGCPMSHWAGDGFCDDVTNNEYCNFDGGDCCGSTVNTQWCSECICFHLQNCNASLTLIGNKVCNDETNNAECDFDGGDCCGSCANIEQCLDCVCHQGELTIDISCK